MKINPSNPPVATTRVAAALSQNKEAQTAISSTDDSVGSSGLKAAADIMKNYDLRNASYEDVKSMGKELYEAGAISGDQLMTITAPVFDKFDLNMNRISSPTEKRDYLQGTEQLLSYAKANQSGDKSSIQQFEKMVNYLQNLASLR